MFVPSDQGKFYKAREITSVLNVKVSQAVRPFNHFAYVDLQQTIFENIVAKGEMSNFSLLPQCFQLLPFIDIDPVFA